MLLLVNGRTSYSFWISEPYRNVRRTVHLEIWNHSVRRTWVRPYWRSLYGERVRRTFFSAPNFRRQFLGNGLSDLHKNFTDFEHRCGPNTVKVSCKSDNPFRDIDGGSWPFVFAVRCYRTLLPYFVRHGTARFGRTLTPHSWDVGRTWKIRVRPFTTYLVWYFVALCPSKSNSALFYHYWL